MCKNCFTGCISQLLNWRKLPSCYAHESAGKNMQDIDIDGIPGITDVESPERVSMISLLSTTKCVRSHRQLRTKNDCKR